MASYGIILYLMRLGKDAPGVLLLHRSPRAFRYLPHKVAVWRGQIAPPNGHETAEVRTKHRTKTPPHGELLVIVVVVAIVLLIIVVAVVVNCYTSAHSRFRFFCVFKFLPVFYSLC